MLDSLAAKTLEVQRISPRLYHSKINHLQTKPCAVVRGVVLP